MRKIIQIATYPNGGLVALCDDGTVWRQDPDGMAWEQINIDKVVNPSRMDE